MIHGLNHVTLAVADLSRALRVYVGVLGARLRARWDRGAYLDLAGTWLCLEVAERTAPRPDDSHLAFSVTAEDLPALAQALESEGCRAWKENRSEGASFYFQDLDGHKLELHAGDLASRLRACREQPYPGMVFFA
jgi:catechol 2,3-dioxygenase-like lactoylglutathione lyase family enzyme